MTRRRHPATRLLLSAVFCCVLRTPAGANVCSGRGASASSCQECLLLHPQCAWCSQEGVGGARGLLSRCDLLENLISKGCGPEFIEGPKSRVTVTQNLPLSSKGSGSAQSDIIQVAPQRVALSLRPGAAASFRVQVRQVEDYPVDLYYLMDLSLSMKDDLENLRSLGTRLAAEMAKLTSNFRLGFGTFVDKNISPFSYTAPKYQSNPCTGYKPFPSCVPSFGFRHVLPLTDRVGDFNAEVQRQAVSRNRDAPEGAFDAILQAAVCKDRVGWRAEASHLLVITTDDVPHVALDGRLAGLVQPHDGHCHLDAHNQYSAGGQLDYPSLALLGEKLNDNNIHLIFAVTRNHYLLYKNFTALIPGTTVEILDQSSQNILQLIVNSYNNIRSKVELSVLEVPDDLVLGFSATCQDGVSQPGVRRCGELRIGDTVSFDVSAEARSCPPPGARHVFAIKPVGFREALEVTVTYDCSCGCSRWAEPGSARCSGNGTYACGVCACDGGFLGARCECGEEEEQEAGSLSSCRESEGHTVCNGRGRCVCGLCSCYPSEFGRISGAFCQCDDFSCARYRGVLCSGHGECDCGECRCHAGYIGENCNCTTESASCVSRDGQMCSGRGVCVCGRCHCSEPGAFGETCEKCPTCPDACVTKRECIECRLYQTGRLADNKTCQTLCKDEIVTVEELGAELPDAVLCVYRTESDCVMRFTYSEEPGGKSILTALREPECGSAPDAKTVLLAVVGSILLVGLVLLALWKLLVTIHDRREFSRFQSERSRAKYEMASNPLYRQPISTHRVDEVHGMMGKSYNGTSNGFTLVGDE